MPGRKLRVQNKILKLAKAGDYYGVKYDKESGLAMRSASKISPKAVYCNEVASDFGTAERHRRTFKNERKTWTFELKLGFSGEVDISDFEDFFAEDPPMMTDPRARLNLVNTQIAHPPVKDPSTGTVATLTIEADVMPI